MIELRGVAKYYQAGKQRLPILRDVDLSIAAGESVAIMGPSGAGKSTLLNILGILDGYDAGEYRLDGKLVKNLSESQAARLRGQSLGFVFQSFNLLPFKSAVENVALPLYYQGVPRRHRDALARSLLERLGLAERLHHRPNEMSGGQRQRVAIARALITEAPVILADEPTGNLDSRSSAEVMDLLLEIQRSGKTLLLVTHSEAIAARAQRIVRLSDGQVVTGG